MGVSIACRFFSLEFFWMMALYAIPFGILLTLLVRVLRKFRWLAHERWKQWAYTFSTALAFVLPIVLILFLRLEKAYPLDYWGSYDLIFGLKRLIALLSLVSAVVSFVLHFFVFTPLVQKKWMIFFLRGCMAVTVLFFIPVSMYALAQILPPVEKILIPSPKGNILIPSSRYHFCERQFFGGSGSIDLNDYGSIDLKLHE